VELDKKTRALKKVGDAWKNPKQRELKADGIKFLVGSINHGCMEKSQAKGIERRMQIRFLNSQVILS
jgi:hypothetical protein